MSLHDTARTIEQNIVEDANGWGESITITPRATNIPVTVRALPMDRRQDQLNEKSQVFTDGMAFLSVFLDTRPVKGDLITYDGRTFVVETMEGVNPYDIFCRTNARHSSGRSTRREK